MNNETSESLLEEYDGCKELMESRETTVIVERTETAHLCTTWRTEINLDDVRTNNGISYEDMSNVELAEAIRDCPGDYIEDLFDGNIVYDKRKDFGTDDEVTFESDLEWLNENGLD